MRTVDAVLFDKTGTLTKGNHAVVDYAAADDWDRDRVLGWLRRLRPTANTPSPEPSSPPPTTPARSRPPPNSRR